MSKNVFKHDKKIYWDRRKKGYRGQVAAPGTPAFFKEQRKVARRLRLAESDRVRGGRRERQKR